MLAVILRELDILWKQRRLSFVIMLAAALLYTLLIGNLYQQQTVQNIPVAVCDLDRSAASRSLVQAVAEADQYTLQEVYTNEAEAVAALENRQVEAVLVIPQDFNKKVTGAEPVNLNYVVDGTNALHSSYAGAPMQSVVGQFAAQYRAQNAMVQGTPYLTPQPVSLSLRLTQNSVQGYGIFYLYGIVLTAAQIGVMLCFGGSVFLDRQLVLEEIFPAGGKGSLIKFWLAKELLYCVFAVMAACLGGLGIMLVWKMPLLAPLLPTLFLFIAFALTIINLAGLVGLLAKTELALVQTLVFYTLPAFLLSGYIWPEEGMPLLIKLLSYAIPLHYILIDFRSLALTGASPNTAVHTLLLLSFAGILFIVNLLLAQRREPGSI